MFSLLADRFIGRHESSRGQMISPRDLILGLNWELDLFPYSLHATFVNKKDMDSVEEGKKSSPGVPQLANYSQAEKELLVTLMGRYKHVIENKKTDAVTSQVSFQVIFPESIFNYNDL